MDKNKAELVRKVGDLVNRRFGGDYRAAFQSYSRKRTSDATVDKDELKDLLADASVGNGMTRGLWADGIVRELDRDGDGRIGWEEFESVIRR
jgi:Ca2+-binding EF-hand superfamily protein